MGDGHAVHLAGLAVCKPRADVLLDPYVHYPALVAADEVGRQHGHIAFGLNKAAVRQKPRAHQRLEAVADTADKAAPFKQALYRPAAFGVFQERGYELARSVGLVAA